MATNPFDDFSSPQQQRQSMNPYESPISSLRSSPSPMTSPYTTKSSSTHVPRLFKQSQRRLELKALCEAANLDPQTLKKSVKHEKNNKKFNEFDNMNKNSNSIIKNKNLSSHYLYSTIKNECKEMKNHLTDLSLKIQIESCVNDIVKKVERNDRLFKLKEMEKKKMVCVNVRITV